VKFPQPTRKIYIRGDKRGGDPYKQTNMPLATYNYFILSMNLYARCESELVLVVGN